jgi:hypothetical protein
MFWRMRLSFVGASCVPQHTRNHTEHRTAIEPKFGCPHDFKPVFADLHKLKGEMKTTRSPFPVFFESSNSYLFFLAGGGGESCPPGLRVQIPCCSCCSSSALDLLVGDSRNNKIIRDGNVVRAMIASSKAFSFSSSSFA